MEDQNKKAIDKTKRSLKRYKKNLKCIARLETKLERIIERLETMRSSNLSGMPRGGTPVTTQDLVAEKLELEERIERLKQKSKRLRSETLEEIDSLEDSTQCEILESFFIDGLELEDIADQEGYTVRHVYRLYREAILELSVKRQ